MVCHRIVLGVVIIIILSVAYFLSKELLPAVHISTLTDMLQGLGPWAAVIGFTAIVVQTFIPFAPFLVLAGANVLVLGLWWGFMINWLSAVTGAILMFYAARSYGQNWAKRKMETYQKMRNLNQFLEKNGFKTVLTLRVFPVVLPSIVNLTSGMSSMRAQTYIAATALGKLPVIFLQSLLGNDLFHFAENKMRFIFILVGLGLFAGIGMKVVRRKMNVS